jgi:hypothetical protein
MIQGEEVVVMPVFWLLGYMKASAQEAYNDDGLR